MQTTNSTAAANPASPASANQATGSTRKAGAVAGGADVFAGLLALVADTHAPTEQPSGPASDADAAAEGQTDPIDAPPDNLLASLLGVTLASGLASGVQGQGRAASSGAAATGSPAVGERGLHDALSPLASAKATTLPGEGPTAPGSGIDIQRLGMVAVDPSEALTLGANLANARPAFAAPPLLGVGRKTAASVTDRFGTDHRATNHRSSQLTIGGGAASATALSTAATSIDTARLQPWSLQTSRSTWAMGNRAMLPLAAQIEVPGLTTDSSETGGGSRDGNRGLAAMLAGSAPTSDSTAFGPGESGWTDSAADSATSPTEAGPTDPLAPEPETAGHVDAHALRHATLRVDDGQEGSIEIQLAMKGQEVSVGFLTDNAEARQSLQHSAAPVLSDLLQRSGMQLGGVSVGGQAMSSDAEQPRQRSEGRPGVAKVGTTAAGGSDALTAGSRRPSVDGSSRLDVFA